MKMLRFQLTGVIHKFDGRPQPSRYPSLRAAFADVWSGVWWVLFSSSSVGELYNRRSDQAVYCRISRHFIDILDCEFMRYVSCCRGFQLPRSDQTKRCSSKSKNRTIRGRSIMNQFAQVHFVFLKSLTLVAGLVFAAPACAVAYSVLDLGGWYGLGSTAYGINESGQVVGDMNTGVYSTVAFTTGSNGIGLMPIGTLGGYQSHARGINASGQVVGWSGTSGGDSHAFMTGPNGFGMTDLGTLGGANSSAVAINTSGQVAGGSYITGGAFHAFITGPNGAGMTDLGTLGGISSGASDINDRGQVVGVSATSSGADHAFITGLDGTGMIDLGTLGGVSSIARGINEDGRVVGTATTSQGAPHAFITGQDGIGMTDLGVLPGGCCFSDAWGINASGQVVGWAASSSGSSHAFVTGANGVGMTDLNDLATLEGDYFLIAYGINDQGQIIAGDSSGRAYLLSPVPEPKAYALILAGLGLVGFVARKQGELARLGAGS